MFNNNHRPSKISKQQVEAESFRLFYIKLLLPSEDKKRIDASAVYSAEWTICGLFSSTVCLLASQPVRG